VNRFLSPGGWVTLLNSVLSAIPIFSSSIHEDVCKGLEKGCDGPNKVFCGVAIMNQLRYLGLVGRMSASLSVMGALVWGTLYWWTLPCYASGDGDCCIEKRLRHFTHVKIQFWLLIFFFFKSLSNLRTD